MKLLVLLVLVPAAFGASVVLTIDAPDTGISGLAYGSGSLWAVDGTTRWVYELNPSSGSIISSFYFDYGIPGGMAFSGSTLHILRTDAGSYYGYVYKYSTAGSYNGMYDATC
ncbi:MAG: hypothetical protein K8S24_10650 [Candidatus Aegiribacteria sp.]|nr:hypothetical protein [Candidatus Aegiribacteria sp.]